MSAAFVVPRKADGGHRDKVWKWCRSYWEQRLPDMPIYEGHDDSTGLFNRSRSMNLAFAQSKKKDDVVVILDADVIADPEQVTRAVAKAAITGKIVVAYTKWSCLTEDGTVRVMAGETPERRLVQVTYQQSVSSLVAVPRKVWNDVGGFDERFTGWGLEDSAFMRAADVVAGRYRRLPGVCWHLWHPVSNDDRRAEREANRVFFDEYRKARTPAEIRAVIAAR